MKFILTLWLSKLVAVAINLIDRSRGSNYSGMIATRLMPDFVRHFKGIDYNKLIKHEYFDAILKKYGFKEWDAIRAAVGHGSRLETRRGMRIPVIPT